MCMQKLLEFRYSGKSAAYLSSLHENWHFTEEGLYQNVVGQNVVENPWRKIENRQALTLHAYKAYKELCLTVLVNLH